MDIKNLRSKINKLNTNIIEESDTRKGLSIIIPVFNGIDHIERCLYSIENQNISTAKFEVVIILNGKFLSELEYLYNIKDYFNSFDLLVLINDKNGAGAARNLGIHNAKYSHIIFIDVDDFISSNFIQANYDNIEKNKISISQIKDSMNGKLMDENPINEKLIEYVKNDISNYRSLNRVLTITACKAIPIEYFKDNLFDENLKSGEDTILFTKILTSNFPEVQVIPIEQGAIYFREIRQGSVSRQETSFDFNITQRLDILRILDPILSQLINYDLKTLVKYKYNAQIVLMNKFLKENQETYGHVVALVQKEKLKNFSFKLLNSNLSSTLVIAYCAPPYSDTSSTIVAKRILEKKEVVDIVSNRMENIRGKDNSLKELIEPYVSDQVINQKNASFANFYFLSTYIDKTFKHYCLNSEKYKKIYSRAMFPVSHIPPLFIKLLDENIHWVAEFSDPLLYDIESNEREAIMDYPLLDNLLKNGLLGGFTEFVDTNMFNLAELIPFALADELVFTNEHQLRYMLERFPENLQNFIKEKAVISPHPTLKDNYYCLEESSYNFNDSYINIGYFGNFYSRRGINEIIKVKEICDSFKKSIVKFHIFTNTKALTTEEKELLKEHKIQVNDYVPFLEFLNLSKKLDILMIFDSLSKDIKSVNPYLPSKLSDYLGSCSKILAVVEKNSVLDKYENEDIYKISLNNEEKYTESAISSLLSKTLDEKENFVYVEQKQQTEIKYGTTFISITDSLNVLGQSNGWLVKPKSYPVKSTKDYEVTIYNDSNEFKEISLKSFYTMKNVINLNITSLNKDYEYENCISLFRDSKSIFLYPNDEYTIKIKYLKDYNKKGFINAGRLLIYEK